MNKCLSLKPGDCLMHFNYVSQFLYDMHSLHALPAGQVYLSKAGIAAEERYSYRKHARPRV